MALTHQKHLLKQQAALHICKEAKVNLSANLCVPFGLYNGAPGKVRDIVYKDGRKPSDGLPDVVLVEFPKYSGPPFLEHHPKIVPIVPVERRIDCLCHGCKRKQVPLRLGWASTIHRCQGITVGSGEINRYIVIHPGTKAFESRSPGALFVSLSRPKSAGDANSDPDFAFHQSVLVNEDRLCHKVQTPTVTARSIEMKRLEKCSIDTKQQFSPILGDPTLNIFLDNIVTSFGS